MKKRPLDAPSLTTMVVRSCHRFIATTHSDFRLRQLGEGMGSASESKVFQAKYWYSPHIDDQSPLLNLLGQPSQALEVERRLGEQVRRHDDLLGTPRNQQTSLLFPEWDESTFSAPASSHCNAFSSVMPPPRCSESGGTSGVSARPSSGGSGGRTDLAKPEELLSQLRRSLVRA